MIIQSPDLECRKLACLVVPIGMSVLCIGRQYVCSGCEFADSWTLFQIQKLEFWLQGVAFSFLSFGPPIVEYIWDRGTSRFTVLNDDYSLLLSMLLTFDCCSQFCRVYNPKKCDLMYAGCLMLSCKFILYYCLILEGWNCNVVGIWSN